jgi:hypothetical protein
MAMSFLKLFAGYNVTESTLILKLEIIYGLETLRGTALTGC